MAPYGTLTTWRSYAAARGNQVPTAADDTTASQALQRGSDYIRHFYVAHFFSSPDDSLIEEAAYEAASIELSTPGFFNKTYTPGEAKVLTEVKGIKWTLIGDGTSDGAMTPTSTMIEAMLGLYTSRNDVLLGIRSV